MWTFPNFCNYNDLFLDLQQHQRVQYLYLMYLVKLFDQMKMD